MSRLVGYVIWDPEGREFFGDRLKVYRLEGHAKAYLTQRRRSLEHNIKYKPASRNESHMRLDRLKKMVIVPVTAEVPE